MILKGLGPTLAPVGGGAIAYMDYSLTLAEEDRYPGKKERKDIVSFQLHISDGKHYMAVATLEPENSAPIPKDGIKKGRLTVKSIVIQPIGSQPETDSGAITYDKSGKLITSKPKK